MQHRFIGIVVLPMALCVALSACLPTSSGSDNGSDGTPSSGGSAGLGGTVGAGGTTSSGGTTTGGTVNAGGVTSSGGTRASGGTVGEGGSGSGSSAGGAQAGGSAPGAGGAAGGSSEEPTGTGGAAGRTGRTRGTGGANGGGTGTGGTTGEGTRADAGAGTGGASGAGGSTSTLAKFSFFVTSLNAMRLLSKSQDGFGGDLRYGTSDGLTGADKICTEIAESSMAGSGAKQWRAFLSVTKGPDGTAVNAADRIGQGPWYDRRGRLLANGLTDLLKDRPANADPAIKDDLPNETGTPNHRPDTTQPAVDNHHFLTGSNTQGKLYGEKATCLDWTSNSRENGTTGRPRIGFSWPAQGRTNWISGQDEGGCGAGVQVGETGGSNPSNPIVGSGGGYGGIYCFALTP